MGRRATYSSARDLPSDRPRALVDAGLGKAVASAPSASCARLLIVTSTPQEMTLDGVASCSTTCPVRKRRPS